MLANECVPGKGGVRVCNAGRVSAHAELLP